MEHGYYIGKIGLVIAYKKHIILGQVSDDIRPFNFQGIETFIPLMGHETHNTNEPLFYKKNMTEWIFLKYAHKDKSTK